MTIKKRRGPAIELVETRRGQHICETTPRYDVMLHGVRVQGTWSQLWFNMRGYVGALPTPCGLSVDIGEKSITAWRKEVRAINREFAALDANSCKGQHNKKYPLEK